MIVLLHKHSNAQRGNIMLAVMVVSAILMAIGATLYNSYIVSESEAVEKSLADIRAYWAMVGTVNYTLGRVGGQGLPCSSIANLSGNGLTFCLQDASTAEPTNPPFIGRAMTDRVGAIQYYLDGNGSQDQFNDDDDPTGNQRDISNPGIKMWRYPVDNFDGVNVPYQIGVQTIIRDLFPSLNSEYPYDGRIRIDLSLVDISTKTTILAPDIKNMPTSFPRMTVGACVVDQSTTSTPPNTLTPPYNSSGNPSYSLSTSCGSGATEGSNKIMFIRWNMPFQ
jgi:hypothetical protein